MGSQNYLVIIGDVVKSREIKDRQRFQEIFKNQFEQTAVFEKDNIVSSFTITIGDEFQGVLNNAARMFKFITDLEYSLNILLAQEHKAAVLKKNCPET